MFILYFIILINLCIFECPILINARTNDSKCNALYYGTMDKIMINTQSQRTKQLMENFYKRRSKQSGMSVGEIKNCYNIKIKKQKK
jgi:hypothetical protein